MVDAHHREAVNHGRHTDEQEGKRVRRDLVPSGPDSECGLDADPGAQHGQNGHQWGSISDGFGHQSPDYQVVGDKPGKQNPGLTTTAPEGPGHGEQTYGLQGQPKGIAQQMGNLVKVSGGGEVEERPDIDGLTSDGLHAAHYGQQFV